MSNTSEAPYFVDQFTGTGVPGDSYTLAFSPVRIDFVFYRKTTPTRSDNPVHILYDEDAAGESKCTLSGAGNRTLTIGSKVVVPADHTLYVGYWYYGPGYDSSLEALRTSEQYDLQGDSESVTTKEKALMVETDTDSHFTTNVSNRSVTTSIGIKMDQENITNMPYNKFKIMEIKMVYKPESELYWCDWRLWFAKQDDFYASYTDPDLDDMWAYVDIASTMLCSLGSTTQEEGYIMNYFFWPQKTTILGGQPAAYPHASMTGTDAPIYYEDEDGTNELHIMLENRSPDVSHEAGADRIKFWFKIVPVR